MLKRARDYQRFSRTIVPVYALYTAGWVIGGVVYLYTGRLGLLWGPLRDLRGAILNAQPLRHVPAADWTAWIPAILCGVFLLTELGRYRRGRRPNAQLLLAAYSVTTVAAVSVVIGREAAESYYGGMAVLAGGLFTTALWSRWRSKIRLLAVGAVVAAAGISMVLLRLRDMARLGTLKW